MTELISTFQNVQNFKIRSNIYSHPIEFIDPPEPFSNNSLHCVKAKSNYFPDGRMDERNSSF